MNTTDKEALWEQAKKEGCNFYDFPSKLTDEQIDPMLRKAVARINASDFVWTAESCQGHPDCTVSKPWGGNVKPMLRLVSLREYFGKVMTAMVDASLGRPDEGWHRTFFQVIPTHVGEKFIEVLVYVEANNVFDRNQGCLLYERFAELVNK